MKTDVSDEQRFIAEIDAFEFGERNVGGVLEALEVWLNNLRGSLQSHRFCTDGMHVHSTLAREAVGIDTVLHTHARACAQPWASLEAAQSLADLFDQRVMLLVFGKFNAGKSAFCNFIAGRFVAQGKTARYFHVEAGRVVETSTAFEEGATETTARLQGVCIGDKLVLIDTPGLHSVVPENAALTQRFIESADGVIWLTSSTSPGQVQELDDLSRELHRNKPLLPVVTRSDEYEEDEVDGEFVRRLCNKSEARRALQEADVQTRAQQKLAAMGVTGALLKPPVSVSVHMARVKGATPPGMREAGFERLFTALLEISGPALDYKPRKRAEIALHHLEENVLDTLHASVFPLLAKVLASAQHAFNKIEAQQTLLIDAICQRVLAVLPEILDSHASERNVTGVIRAVTGAIDEAFPCCVREFFSDYDVSHEKGLTVLDLDVSAGFEDIAIEMGDSETCAREVVGVDYRRLHGALKQAVHAAVRKLSREVASQARASINQLIVQADQLHDALIQSKAQLTELKIQIRTHVM